MSSVVARLHFGSAMRRSGATAGAAIPSPSAKTSAGCVAVAVQHRDAGRPCRARVRARRGVRHQRLHRAAGRRDASRRTARGRPCTRSTIDLPSALNCAAADRPVERSGEDARRAAGRRQRRRGAPRCTRLNFGSLPRRYAIERPSGLQASGPPSGPSNVVSCFGVAPARASTTKTSELFVRSRSTPCARVLTKAIDLPVRRPRRRASSYMPGVISVAFLSATSKT